MELGGRISSQALDKYGESILAVFIYGSTAKKLDRPYSDLEIVVVVRDGLELPIRYYLYQGLIVEIDYRQEKDILKSARRVTSNWPIEADQYRNRIMLFERDEWTRKLDEAIREADRADFTEALRIATGSVVESLAVLKNAQLTGDELDLRTRGTYLAADAAKAVLLLNRKYVVTTSWFWKQAFECTLKPSNFEELVLTLVRSGQATIEQVVKSGEALAVQVIELVRAHGVLFESEQLSV